MPKLIFKDETSLDKLTITREFKEDPAIHEVMFFIENCYPHLKDEIYERFVIEGDDHVRKVVDVSMGSDKRKALQDLQYLADKIGCKVVSKKK